MKLQGQDFHKMSVAETYSLVSPRVGILRGLLSGPFVDMAHAAVLPGLQVDGFTVLSPLQPAKPGVRKPP